MRRFRTHDVVSWGACFTMHRWRLRSTIASCEGETFAHGCIVVHRAHTLGPLFRHGQCLRYTCLVSARLRGALHELMSASLSSAFSWDEWGIACSVLVTSPRTRPHGFVCAPRGRSGQDGTCACSFFAGQATFIKAAHSHAQLMLVVGGSCGRDRVLGIPRPCRAVRWPSPLFPVMCTPRLPPRPRGAVVG